MFLVSDTLNGRQKLIRSYSGKNITLGVLLSVVDFEWTVRRAIIALGFEPTKHIRKSIDRCSGPTAYKKAWGKHVFPYRAKQLNSVVPDWDFLSKQSFILRHKIAHGVQVTADEKYAAERRDCALEASKAIVEYSNSCGIDLYSKLPIRKKLTTKKTVSK